MPRVLLAGAFGQRNPGDDALLSAFAAALPGWELVTPADNPAAIHCGDPVTAVPKVPRHVATALLSSDAVVFGGGTVFKLLGAASGRHPLELLLRGLTLARAARALGRPVALVGVGAGALGDRRARTLARRLATSADMLVVRDAESADILADVGVPVPIRVGADAAWSLLAGPGPVTGPLPRRSRVVLTLSQHAGGLAAVPVLAGALAQFTRERDDVCSIHLEPWQLGGPGLDDLELARSLQAALHVAGCPDVTVGLPPTSLDSAARSYRDARLVIGQRFHSLIAAAAVGCRFVAVPHEAKLAALGREFAQASLPADAGPRTVTDVLHGAIDGPRPDAATAARHTRAANAMLALMRTLLDGGQDASSVELRALQLRPEALVR